MARTRPGVVTLLAAVVAAGCSSSGMVAAPIIDSFTATPPSLPIDGGTVTLAWTVSAASSLSIDQGVGSVTPVTTGSTPVQITESTTFTLTATNSAASTLKLVSVCVSGPVTLTVTTPSSYTCMQNYQAEFAITNDSCDELVVQSIDLSATVLAGSSPGCNPPGNGHYPPTTAGVARNRTATVFDLTSGAFCCTSPGCPADYTCFQDYEFSVETSAGTLTADAGVTLDLGGCTVICP
jgi:hypothetical protein